MNQARQRAKYLISDFLNASVVWLLLNIIRYFELAQYDGYDSIVSFFSSHQVIKVQILIPFFWLILNYFSGYYNKPLGKSRISELFTTFITTTIGVVFIFFTVILNDLPRSFGIYYTIFFAYFFMQFFFTYLCRYLITTHALRKVQQREWVTNVLVIGAGDQAAKIKPDLLKLGYRIVGFVKENKQSVSAVPEKEILAHADELSQIITQHPVDELILIPESFQDDSIVQLLYSLYPYKRPVKIWADKNKPLHRVEVKTIHAIPLIDVTANNFSEAEKNIKKTMDKIIALLVLILLSPLYAYLAIRVRNSSKGSVFFKQERIGYMGQPFYIYKFRTMYADAAQQGSLLTEKDDPRVTPFGRFLRKYRLDELPQFWNILIGDMSLVGPRPEQRYYIDQIVKKAPYYYLLHNVKPGLTSWGMVKYGYADTVDKMIDRLDYDIMYYENMSLTLDLTILIYTVKIVFTGKGI